MNALSASSLLAAPAGLSAYSSLDVLASEQILLNRVAQIERQLQALSARLAAEDRGAPGESDLPNALDIDAESQVELANGFYLREWDAAGNAFRWAGRSEYFEFRFFLDRRSTLPFSMRGVLAPGIAGDAVQALVDYRPIPVRMTQDGAMVEIDGRIPADPLGRGVTLTFLCPTVAAPVAEDARRLSFAFCRLAVGEAKARPAHGNAPPVNASPVDAPALKAVAAEAAPQRRRA